MTTKAAEEDDDSLSFRPKLGGEGYADFLAFLDALDPEPEEREPPRPSPVVSFAPGTMEATKERPGAACLVAGDDDASSVGTDFTDDSDYAGFLSFLASPARGKDEEEEEEEETTDMPEEEAEVPLAARYDIIAGDGEAEEEKEEKMTARKEEVASVRGAASEADPPAAKSRAASAARGSTPEAVGASVGDDGERSREEPPLAGASYGERSGASREDAAMNAAAAPEEGRAAAEGGDDDEAESPLVARDEISTGNSDEKEEDSEKTATSKDGVVAVQQVQAPLIAKEEIGAGDCEEEENEGRPASKEEVVAVRQARVPPIAQVEIGTGDSKHEEEKTEKIDLPKEEVFSVQKEEASLLPLDRISMDDSEEEYDEKIDLSKEEAVTVQQAEAPLVACGDISSGDSEEEEEMKEEEVEMAASKEEAMALDSTGTGDSDEEEEEKTALAKEEVVTVQKAGTPPIVRDNIGTSNNEEDVDVEEKMAPSKDDGAAVQQALAVQKVEAPLIGTDDSEEGDEEEIAVTKETANIVQQAGEENDKEEEKISTTKEVQRMEAPPILQEKSAVRAESSPTLTPETIDEFVGDDDLGELPRAGGLALVEGSSGERSESSYEDARSSDSEGAATASGHADESSFVPGDGDDESSDAPADSEFANMARRASSMTIGDVEVREVAAWVSVLDIMACRSSDDSDRGYDDDGENDVTGEEYGEEAEKMPMPEGGNFPARKGGAPPASRADSPVFKSMPAILARETTPETIDESVSDDKVSLLTGDPSLGEASPPPALPFDDSSTTREAESDEETANSFDEPPSVPKDAGRRRTALLEGGDGYPDAADDSSERSVSDLSSVDDVPSPRAEFGAPARRASSVTIRNDPSPRAIFGALARRASSMTIGDIETEEMAAWVSVLDVMECQSSDDEEDDDKVRAEIRTSSPAPPRVPRTSFRRTTPVIVG